VNKAITANNATGDNNLHITSVNDTPLKKKDKNNPSSPGTPCPGTPCSELELPFNSLV